MNFSQFISTLYEAAGAGETKVSFFKTFGSVPTNG